MKYKIKLRFLIILVLANFAGAYAQIALNGKTYTAQISEACKEFSDGGCMIYTYCILSFEKEKVNISYNAKASCTSKEREAFYQENAKRDKKTYSWFVINNRIHIEGFNDYGDFAYYNNKLVGKKNVNDKLENLEFTELIPGK
jgi:hypothetical protein